MSEAASDGSERGLSIWDRPERAGRGGTALSRDQIVRAAIGLIDEEGPDALSMRRLASRMGVGAMSLYWHVERKADLMELVSDAIFGELDLPDPSGDWRTDLRLIAVRTRALFLRHPWLLQAMLAGSNTPHFGPNFLRHVDFTFASLVRLGLPVRAMIPIAGTVDAYVFGSVLSRTVGGGNDRDEDARRDTEAQFLAALGRGAYPTLATMREAYADWDLGEDADEQTFLFGLDATLDGLATRIAAMTACTGGNPSDCGAPGHGMEPVRADDGPTTAARGS